MFHIVSIAADKHVYPSIRTICSLNQTPFGSPVLPISINLPTLPTKRIIIDKPCIPIKIPRPTISLPLVDPKVNNDEIQAARLIVIRRNKMKKHKLRKLRKRMKFVWAKIRQKREMRKEKAFQAELIAQVSIILLVSLIIIKILLVLLIIIRNIVSVYFNNFYLSNNMRLHIILRYFLVIILQSSMAGGRKPVWSSFFSNCLLISCYIHVFAASSIYRHF